MLYSKYISHFIHISRMLLFVTARGCKPHKNALLHTLGLLQHCKGCSLAVGRESGAKKSPATVLLSDVYPALPRGFWFCRQPAKPGRKAAGASFAVHRQHQQGACASMRLRVVCGPASLQYAEATPLAAGGMTRGRARENFGLTVNTPHV